MLNADLELLLPQQGGCKELRDWKEVDRYTKACARRHENWKYLRSALAVRFSKRFNDGGKLLPFCKKCGAELKEDAQFCHSCGTPVDEEKRVRPKGAYGKEREACFGPPGSGGGMWGGISFGVFLIGLAILWLLDYFWPGILILIGLMVIIGGLVALSRR